MTASPGHGTTETKKATINGLAVVGFGALIVGGILLAIYTSKYVPDALSRLASAVYLSSDEEQNPEEESPAPEEEETPEPSRPIIVFPDANDEPEEEEEAPSTGGPQIVTPPVAVSPNPPVYYPPQPVTPQLYGRADLALRNARVGYFRGSTFVEDDEVPSNRDAGLKFTVRNEGTNVASGWRLRVDVEGEDTVTGSGGTLMPNGYQNFTLRIENPEEGENLRIEIEVDYTDRVDESDERNNDDDLDIDIDD